MRPGIKILAVLAISSLAASGETRRAVVVGIDEYRPQGRPAAGGRQFSNLEGAVADAKLFCRLLIDRFGFRSEDIVFLTDRHSAQKPEDVATRGRILQAFRQGLIEDLHTGDRAVFYFAGHGSRVRNLKTANPDGLDKTLVPADASDGAPDIRDPELVRLYRQAADKGVVLTVIADSCHSGGIIRGVSAPAKRRALADDPRVVSDPPDVDPETHQPLPNPTTRGVLVIAAAQDNEEAEEMISDGQPHGVFTTFFARAILAAAVNAPVSELFARSVAMMRNAGRMQLPAIAGEGRLDRGLFGQPVDHTSGLPIAVEEVRSDGKVKLRGGLALGLMPGCELVHLRSPEVRVRIEGEPTLANAEGAVIQGGPLHTGDILQIDRWALSPDLLTSFYLPSAGSPSLEQLKAIADRIRNFADSRHIRLTDDPAAAAPSDILRFESGRWELESRRGGTVSRTSLGTTPNLAPVAGKLSGNGRSLFVDYPPPAEFSALIRQRADELHDAVKFADQRAGALYHLTGVWQDGQLRYGWVLSTAAADPDSLPIPPQTRFLNVAATGSAESLEQFALNITRLRIWLNLEIPDVGSTYFPFTLAVRNEATKEIKTSGEWVEGERYSLILRAKGKPAASREELPQRWIYVAALDRSGKMTLLLPREENSSGNHFPRDGDPTDEISLLSMNIDDPLGVDTLILLASDESIDPFALAIDPVVARGAPRGAAGSLSAFLFHLQNPTRGETVSAPTGWSIERISLRSVAHGSPQKGAK